jgi:hypothetical protein
VVVVVVMSLSSAWESCERERDRDLTDLMAGVSRYPLDGLFLLLLLLLLTLLTLLLFLLVLRDCVELWTELERDCRERFGSSCLFLCLRLREKGITVCGKRCSWLYLRVAVVNCCGLLAEFGFSEMDGLLVYWLMNSRVERYIYGEKCIYGIGVDRYDM